MIKHGRGKPNGGMNMIKKIIARFSAWLRKRMHNRVIKAAPWYVGDPCYIIPDEQWDAFCNASYTNRPAEYEEHVDSRFVWEGREITLWENGGDGSWSFHDIESANKKKTFHVDGGCFGVIDLRGLPVKQSPIGEGILFEHEPDLYVEDGVVFLNRECDTEHQECEGWRCRQIIQVNEVLSCQYGNCDDGCDNCFECECCEKCGDTKDDCACGEEE